MAHSQAISFPHIYIMTSGTYSLVLVLFPVGLIHYYFLTVHTSPLTTASVEEQARWHFGNHDIGGDVTSAVFHLSGCLAIQIILHEFSLTKETRRVTSLLLTLIISY